MNGQRSGENIAGAVIATVGPLVGAGLCTAWDVPAAVPAILAGAAVAGVAVRDHRTGTPWSERAFRLASGLAAGAWTTWSAVTGPWHLANLVAGAGAALFGAFVAPAFVGEDAPIAQAPVGPDAAATDRATVWKQRIERLARLKPITITKEEDWPNGAGFTLHIVFAPESGETWKKIDDVKHSLAAAALLDDGCAIGVSQGRRQGTAIVRIPTVYTFDRDLPLPDDCSPLSVWDDFPIGNCEDTDPALVNIRQAAGLFAGRRGGGKTNLLKVLIGQVLRCRDSLVWVVDLNGGGSAVPFMLPYVDGEVATPPIDWIAATPEEAVILAEVAVAIAKDRKARYGALTARSGGDLLPVTKDLPQITIVVDESAEVENDPVARKAMERLQEVLRIGRAEAVNVLFSALRATQETVPVNTRKQTTLKICGQVEDETEIEYVLPGSKVRSDDLVHPGTVFMRRSELGKAVRQVKVYRTLPDKIRRIVLATESIRPSLDPAGQQVGGRAYAERMQRLQPWLDRLAGKTSTEQHPAPSSGTGSPLYALHQAIQSGAVQADEQTRKTLAAGAAIAEANDAPSTPADRDARRSRAREQLRRFAARTEVSQMPKGQLDDVFGSLVADLRPVEQDGEGWRPELLLDVAREAGPKGIGPTEMQRKLAERGITVSMKTINKWVPRYASEGKLRKLDGGKYAV
ncbi:hypothetical protein [Micromonospora sp. DPT]|uniref:hypothetical protein n=1 Tax=Micromonospora sp. DPT TaxID=3142975 RepID=UPI003208F3BF